MDLKWIILIVNCFLAFSSHFLSFFSYFNNYQTIIHSVNSIYHHEMKILVKYLRRFLFCDDLSFLKEIKNTLKNTNNIENFTYFELMTKILNIDMDLMSFRNKEHIIMDKIEEKHIINQNFDELIRLLNEENQFLKHENSKFIKLYQETKKEMEETKDFIDNINTKEDRCYLLLKEIMDLKIKIMNINEVLLFIIY